MSSSFPARPGAGKIVTQAFLVTICGTAVALAANFISPRGLSLTRNYFPAVAKPESRSVVAGVTTPSTTQPAPSKADEKPGMATLTTAQALELFRDPNYEAELFVFIDARADRHYEGGHIPAAYQLDRYYPERHLATVLPACLNALRVVVYCTGGECEDSHFAAQLLQDAGVAPERLAIYSGGITEWEAKRLPIEVGQRRSGSLRDAKP
jgi:rhodanese-related sulfurtransferase